MLVGYQSVSQIQHTFQILQASTIVSGGVLFGRAGRRQPSCYCLREAVYPSVTLSWNNHNHALVADFSPEVSTKGRQFPRQLKNLSLM